MPAPEFEHVTSRAASAAGSLSCKHAQPLPNLMIPSATHGEDREQSSGHTAILVPGSHTVPSSLCLPATQKPQLAWPSFHHPRPSFCQLPRFLVERCLMRTRSSRSHIAIPHFALNLRLGVLGGRRKSRVGNRFVAGFDLPMQWKA